ncbi:hypothetical protein [Streptomyces vastus]|uniref:Uncharacterized protein n=1 Tax=Streptomyces vastus TaxID=285451 RepID=A0ABN3Q9L6_9ACTN
MSTCLQPVAVWRLTWVQSLADECQRRDVDSLAGLEASVFRRAYHQRMVQEMQQALRKVYFTPSDTRDAGYIETELHVPLTESRSWRTEGTRALRPASACRTTNPQAVEPADGQAQFNKVIGAIRVLPEESNTDVKMHFVRHRTVALSLFHYERDRQG